MRIFLVGYMCSGKSKTGKALAAAMKYKFLDTDTMIEEKTGSTIRQIFHEKGEEFFREMEQDALLSTFTFNKVVIATGGGLPCFNDNMKWMNEKGITVYLEASEGVLFHRLAMSKQGRPLIENLDDISLMERITRDLTIRVPVYSQAQITVNAVSLNLNTLKQKIEKLK
jgi:shikimate kinase